MKKALLSLAVVVAMMSFAQVSAFAESNPTDQGKDEIVILPMAQLLDQTVNFSGQGSANFEYATNGGTEKVRLYFENKGSKTVSIRLKDPKGYVWLEGLIAAGKSYTTTYDWTSTQAGTWKVELNNSDGSQGSVWISVRSNV